MFVSRTQPMVDVRGEELRALDAIAVDLSGGRVESFRPPPPPQLVETKPAFSVGKLSIVADPLFAFDSALNFQLQAAEVEFRQARQPDEKLLLVPARAVSGNLRIEAARAALEKLVARAAAKLAQKQGVTIESVTLELTQVQPRIVDARVNIAARKLFFRPVLDLSARMAVSDDLIATISDLKCSGDGTIATLACAAITPQFQRIEQRPLPLSALPLGEIHLRDVALDVTTDRVSVVANFGERSVRG